MFTTIASIAFLVFVALSVLVGILSSRKRFWTLSLARIVTTIVSAVISAFVTSWISWLLAGMLVDTALGIINNEQISGIVNDIVSAKGLACLIIALFLTFLIFTSVFVIFKTLLNAFVAPLISKLIVKIAAASSKKDVAASEAPYNGKKYRKLTASSAILSVICSLMVYFIVLVPIVGTLDIVGNVAGAVSGENQLIADISDAAVNNVGSKTAMFLGERTLFSAMTTHKVNGVRVRIADEEEFVTTAAHAIKVISNESATEEEKAQEFRDLGICLEHTSLIPMLLTDFVNAANEPWLAGEDFHGIAAPAVEAPLDRLVDKFLECTKDSTYDTMRHDLRSAMELCAIVTENGIKLSEPQDITVLLANETLIHDISFELLDNERLYHMITELLDVSLDTIGTALEIPENNEAAYDKLAGDLAAAVNAELPALEGANNASLFKQVFRNFGIVLTDEELNTTANALIAKRGEGEMTADRMKAILAEGVGALKIGSADELIEKFDMVTNEELTAKGGEPEDHEREALAMAHIMKSLSKLVEDIENPEFADSIELIVADLGPLFEAMTESEMVGDDATKNLLFATLQSPRVRSILNLSIYDASDIALSIYSSISEKNTYTIQMKSLSNSIIMMKSGSNNQNSSEAVLNLLGDLTPETAESLKKLSSADMVQNYGVSEENAGNVSSFMTDMFGNMSSAKESGMSDEEYQKEADAVSDMMIIVMGTHDEGNQTVFGKENSMTGITVEEYVDRILGSRVMSQTIVNSVYGGSTGSLSPTLNPLSTGGKLNSAEIEEMVSVLDARWQSQLALNLGEAQNEQYKKTLVAIASMVNLEVTTNDSNHIVLA